jgi:hypothetical protein
MPDIDTVRSALRAMLEAEGLRKTAQITGIPDATIARFASGAASHKGTVLRLAVALGVPVSTPSEAPNP